MNVLLSLFSADLSAQFEAKKVPRSQRRNVILLSRYLCEGLNTDSAKVIAISSWMAANITYNHRALINGNWEQISSDNLLKSKKGLCGDFSNLFNELCKVQGIASYDVIGYTKTFNYTPYDSLIKAEHSWNVVLVDGQWKPLDLSWSVGYLKQRKQKLRTLLYMTFGIPYRIKYKFVKELNNSFILIDPKIFVKTHLPLQPYWQLLNNPVPMKAFEADTVTRYLDSNKQQVTKPYNYKVEIKRFKELTGKDKHMVGAKQAFSFNPQNHRILGLGYYNFSQELLYEIKVDDVEEKQIEILDSCITLFDSASIFYDYYKNDLKRELKRRLNRNTEYKNKLLKINKTYIKAFKETQKGVRKQNNRNKKAITKSVSRRKKAIQNSKKQKKKNLKKVKRPTTEGDIKDAKVVSYQFEINRLDTILSAIMKVDLTSLIEKRKLLVSRIDSQHINLTRAFYNTNYLTLIAKKQRFGYNEYSRSYLDPLKDSIGKFHSRNQLLFDSIQMTYDSITQIRDSIRNHTDLVIEYQLDKLKTLQRLKRASVDDLFEDQIYKFTTGQVAQNYSAIAAQYDSTNSTFKKRLEELKLYEKPIKQSVKNLGKEIKTEYKRYRFNASWFRHLNVIYKRQCDGLKLASKRAIRSCANRISDLQVLIKERDREKEIE